MNNTIEEQKKALSQIPEVPTENPNFDPEKGLKNLAGWIARYKNLGLEIEEVSPLVKKLLEEGVLDKFEPDLLGFQVGYDAGEEEYDVYEFGIRIADFVNLEDGSWVSLHFAFITKNCLMFITDCGPKERLDSAMEKIFRAIDVKPLTTMKHSREISWQTADEIIINYLKLIKGMNIPSVPRY